MAVNFSQPLATHGGLNWDAALEAALTELKTKANRADQGIPSSDLNLITESGMYYGSGLTNAPTGSTSGFMILTMIRPDGTTGAQLALAVNGDALYFRRRLSSAWTAWRTVTFT